MTEGQEQAALARTGDPGQGGSGKLVQMFNLQPKSLTEAMEFSKLMARSSLVPDSYKGKPQDILVAVQMAAEVGLSPLQGVNSIAVINGRPSMWGDAVLAVIRNARVLDETFGNGGITEIDAAETMDLGYGECEVKRKGWEKPLKRRFTYEMAEKAGLIARSKGQRGDGPWTTYPGRMLMMRARSWALRDACGDVLKGLHVREELDDFVSLGRTPDGIEIGRSRSDIEPGAVDNFLGSGGGSSGQSRPQTREESIAAPAGEPQTWRGVLENISRQQGGTGKKKWTRYEFQGSDGFKASTFDEGIVTGVRDKGITKGDEVILMWEKNAKGYPEVVSVHPAAPEQEQEESGGESLFDAGTGADAPAE